MKINGAIGLHSGFCSRFVSCGLFWLALAIPTVMPVALQADDEQNALLQRLEEKTQVTDVAPSREGGRGVRLTYYVPVNASVFWKFKTDFQNEWLVTNDYIEVHRFIRRQGNTVITETRYTHGPDVFFRWETRLFPEIYIMHYTLLNPEECGQKFNRGRIEIENDGDLTRVTHTSYFDFTGAFLWAHIPGPWGMTGFLRYTALWEQETILRLQSRYRD
ncbi:MAG TPA: hypothetical protein ACFCUC_03365 [Desulfobacterales bacterium]